MVYDTTSSNDAPSGSVFELLKDPTIFKSDSESCASVTL